MKKPTLYDDDPRSLSFLIAALMYNVEHYQPVWFRGRDVWVFKDPESGEVVYSYDEHGCNAMLYRNGIDAKGGTAKPLPHYASDLGACQELFDWLTLRQYEKHKDDLLCSIHLYFYSKKHILTAEIDQRSVGVAMPFNPEKTTVDDSVIARAVCLAVTKLFAEEIAGKLDREVMTMQHG